MVSTITGTCEHKLKKIKLVKPSECILALISHVLVLLQDHLPPVLYIQMDNTCRDNKNKYTLTFAALLVELGIFKKVCD